MKSACFGVLLLWAVLAADMTVADRNSDPVSTAVMRALLGTGSGVTARPNKYKWHQTEAGLRDMEAKAPSAAALAANVTPEVSEALLPAYHITGPPGSWINDPCGMYQSAFDGTFHVFFQLNPAAPVWGPPRWGHVISSDFAHWKRLPDALVPDLSWDQDGIFSGSTTVLPDGTPVILYTGVSNFTELDYFYQVQGMAVPSDIPDPSLNDTGQSVNDPQVIRWVKSAAPAKFELPPGGDYAQWRDPTTAWTGPSAKDPNKTLYYTIIGGQVDCVGAAPLYSSPDFETWTYEGDLFSQVDLASSNNACATPPANGFKCEQFGLCRSWECPEYFEIDGVQVFKWSEQREGRTPFGLDYYVISDKLLQFGDANSSSAFQDSYNGKAFQPLILDYGSIYASKSFPLRDGRRIWYSWVFETAAGCSQMCSPGTPFTNALNWQGAQSLPREVTYDAAAAALILYPAEEVKALRNGTLYNDTVSFAPNAQGQIEDDMLVPTHSANGSNNRQLEILLNFTFSTGASDGAAAPLTPAGPFSFRAGTKVHTGDAKRTKVSISGYARFEPPFAAAAGESARVRILNATVAVDRSKSGGATNTTTEGGPIPLPPNGLVTSAVELRVFVDHSLIEVYAMEGRGRVSSKIYPLNVGTPWGVSVHGVSSLAPDVVLAADATIWRLESAWVNDVFQ